MNRIITSMRAALAACSLICLVSGCTDNDKLSIKWEGALTDKLEGWKFEPSHPEGGMTYNEFEGYYPDKGGKLISRRIELADKEPGVPAYYKIKFSAECADRGYQGIDFYNAEGKRLADNYDVIYATGQRDYERVFYAMPEAASVEVFFQSPNGLKAWDLSLESTTAEEAARYCESVYSTLPAMDFTAPEDAFSKLPRTAEALRSGGTFNVLMLGDSIMQDTFHSMFYSLVKSMFPRSDFRWTVSMRGSTGCWYYEDPENFEQHVGKYAPDLIMIGGISNYREGTTRESLAIRKVAAMAKERFGCEVLILSAALSIDIRPENLVAEGSCNLAWNWEEFPLGNNTSERYAELCDFCEEDGYAIWDLMTPTYGWLFASGVPFEHYSRDMVHSGERGKQIIAHAMAEYFRQAL